MVTSPSYPAEAPNGAGLNLVTLLKPKGKSNGEHKASLTIARVLSTRRLDPIPAYRDSLMLDQVSPIDR